MNAELVSPIGVLPNGWSLDKLINLTTKIGSGATPRGGESAYLPERVEYAFVRSQNVFDYHFSPSGLTFISKQDAEKLKGVHLQSEDILLNITGDGITFARACLVPDNILPAAVNQHVSIIRLDKSKCLPGYLLAYLCLPQIKEYIANFNAGGSRRAITKGHIESFEVPLAPMPIQEYIQKITFDFIYKMELNRQINQTLEGISQAIFKSWFVDFEPTRAKITSKENGQNPEFAAMAAIAGKEIDELGELSAEQFEQLKSTAALFPDVLVESELGQIPEGWSIKKIVDCVKRLSVGKKFSQKNAQKAGDIPILDQGKSGIIGYHDEEPGVQASPEDPVIVFANHTCYMRFIMHDFSAIQNVLPFKGYDLNIFWLFQSTYGKQEFIEYKGHWPDFSIKEIIIPNNNLDSVYGDVIKQNYFQVFENEKENVILEQLRDTLLPKLLSGELEVVSAN